MSKGFTLIELVVVIAIITVLSGIILFSVTQYINRGKDSNISGNLVVLIPAGEVFYNANGNNYNDNNGNNFCDPEIDSVVKNAIAQMPPNPTGDCLSGLTPGLCCNAESQAWAACAQEFTGTAMAYCVDSRGVKEEIDNAVCTANLLQCP